MNNFSNKYNIFRILIIFIGILFLGLADLNAQVDRDTISDEEFNDRQRLGIPNRQDSIDMGLIIEAQPPNDSIQIDTLVTIDTIPKSDSLIVDSLLIDSLNTDTLMDERKWQGVGHFFKHDYINPRKAFFIGLIFPGGGQIYNKRYWKLPFAYAILGGAGYGVIFNTREYRRFRTAYENRVMELPDEFENTITSLEKLKSISDSYRSSLELSYVLLVGGYLFIATEALVDAHLKTFDVSEDLSLKIKPVLSPMGSGVGVVFNF